MLNKIANVIGILVGASIRTLQNVLGILWTAFVWFVKGFIIGFVLTTLFRVFQNMSK